MGFVGGEIDRFSDAARMSDHHTSFHRGRPGTKLCVGDIHLSVAHGRNDGQS